MGFRIVLFRYYFTSSSFRPCSIYLLSTSKKDYGKLPESVKDLNLAPEMGEGPYYEKIDSLKYIVYFNIGFDNTLTYYSESKDWKENP